VRAVRTRTQTHHEVPCGSGSGSLLLFVSVLLIILASLALSSCAGYTTAASGGNSTTGNPANPAAGVLSPSVSSLSFGNVAVGNVATQMVSVTNTGTATVKISQAVITGSGFEVVSGGGATSVPVGQSSNVQVQFAPTAEGSDTATLAVMSDASNSPLGISLSGTGAGGALSASPSSANFGSLPVGASASIGVTVSNLGTAAVSITASSITGTGFSMSKLSPQTLNPNQATSFTVTFAPTNAIAVTGSVSITSNAPGSPITIALAGTGTQPQIAANPTSVSFGTVTDGTSNSQTITLENQGNATLTFSQIAVAGTGFTETGLSTSTTIAAGGSTTFNAVFTPSSPTTVPGSITLTTNGTPSPFVINLSGTGAAASLSLGASPSTLSFGNVNDGSNYSLATSITNNGNSNITVSGVAVIGAGFSASGISSGTMLTPGQTVTLTAVFAPTTPGAVTGASITVTSNAAPLTIGLSGTGTHSVLLEWTPSPTAGVAYNVFRGVSSGGEGTTPLNASPVSATSYTDTNVASGQTYFYTVEAVDSGGSSAPSNEAQAGIPTP